MVHTRFPLPATAGKVTDVDQALWSFLNGYLNTPTPTQAYDWLIGLGCADIRIAELAADCYLNGQGKKILYSGGFGRITRSINRLTEAATFKDCALAMGVPIADIVVETKSSNTAENITFALKLLNQSQAPSVAFVCRNIFRPRVYAVIKRHRPDLPFALLSPKLTLEQYLATEKDPAEETLTMARAMMAGEVDRLLLYPKKDWQIALPIPPDVIAARDLLKLQGYTRFSV